MEAATGRSLGILDGGVVTARRTAALSLLAARELAPRPNGPLLIVGAGTQGRAHLEAFHEGLGTSKVFLKSRTEERAEALAEYAESLGMEVRVVEVHGEALGEGEPRGNGHDEPRAGVTLRVFRGRLRRRCGLLHPGRRSFRRGWWHALRSW